MVDGNLVEMGKLIGRSRLHRNGWSAIGVGHVVGNFLSQEPLEIPVPPLAKLQQCS